MKDVFSSRKIFFSLKQETKIRSILKKWTVNKRNKIQNYWLIQRKISSLLSPQKNATRWIEGHSEACKCYLSISKRFHFSPLVTFRTSLCACVDKQRVGIHLTRCFTPAVITFAKIFPLFEFFTEQDMVENWLIFVRLLSSIHFCFYFFAT